MTAAVPRRKPYGEAAIRADPDRDQPVEPALVRLHDLVDRVRPAGGGVQSPSDERGTCLRRPCPARTARPAAVGRRRSEA